MDVSNELQRYQAILGDRRHGSGSTSATSKIFDPAAEELKMAPLVWWDVKQRVDLAQNAERGYAVLGHVPGDDQNPIEGVSTSDTIVPGADDAHRIHETTENPDNALRRPILLNTDTPWSAFLCGSQGSGKSHTLSCILENCLLTDPAAVCRIGRNPHPLAGLVFHYDRCQGSGVCEAAYLCTDIETTVLVSPSNYAQLKTAYKVITKQQGGKVKVKPLYILPKYLDTERVKTLMAVGKDDSVPLYMQTMIMILRQMAIDEQVTAAKREKSASSLDRFDYAKFKRRLAEKKFEGGQKGPMSLRLDLLESFMEDEIGVFKDVPEKDFLTGRPGTLTIVDLTDPVIDPDSACVLFDICLSVFIQQTQQCGKIVALDEAHNYMTEGSNAANAFTEKLLRTVREQRHQAVRVVIATQEPGINTALVDLCSITMVHRCTSPAWFAVLKEHVAGLYLNSLFGTKHVSKSDKEVFEEIVGLQLGESLLFCPTAAVGVERGKVRRMEGNYVRFKTRQRLTADGGRSKLAAEHHGESSQNGEA